MINLGKQLKIYLNRLNIFSEIALSYRIFIMISILIILSLSTFFYFSEIKWSSLFSQKSTTYLKQINEQILNNVDRNVYEMERLSLIPYLDDYIIMLLSNENSGDEYSFDMFQKSKAVSSLFFSYIQARQDLFSYRIFDLEGNDKLCVYKTDIKTEGDVYNEPWFRKAVNSPSINAFIAHYKNTYLNKDIIAIVRPIYDHNTLKPYGVVSIEQEVEEYEKIISNIRRGSSNTIVLLDQNNQIVCTSGNLRSEFLNNIDSSKPYVEFNVSGEKFISTSSLSEKTGFKAVNIVSYSEFEKESSDIKNGMFVILVICIFIALFLSLIFISSITKPIKKLLFAMKKVQEGNMDIHVNLERNDEIGKLSKGFNNMVSELNELISREYKSKILKKDAQLNALQAQINPHFLYNTLDTLRGIAIYEGAPKAASIAAGMSHILRYSLNKEGYIVNLSEEIECVKNYLNIQNTRFGNKFELDVDIEPDFLALSIPRLTLQPIVENSILHGMEDRMEPGCIGIRAAKIENNTIQIVISDNGNGIESIKLEEIRSTLQNTTDEHFQGKIGIFNVNERIKLYYGNQYGIEVDSEPAIGTNVKIYLPIIYH